MSVYYNEIDLGAATWLRELIIQGHLPHGEVDTRSIEDVTPADVRGFTQCHFFAGIGGWAHALTLAGWPTDRPIWTGSCPCQPFSAAGQGKGFADERHVWPAFHWLVDQCRPSLVVGEQVDAPAARLWFDLVSTDLEGSGYTCGAVDVPAAGVGAPHIRQRMYWLAHTRGERRQQERRNPLSDENPNGGQSDSDHIVTSDGQNGELADSDHSGPQGRGRTELRKRASEQPVGTSRPSRGVADTRHQQRGSRLSGVDCETESARESNHGAFVSDGGSGFWSAADWIPCRDDKFRPVEPGTFPLADGIPARVGRLRGYGNAIVPQVAAAFIEAYLDTETA